MNGSPHSPPLSNRASGASGVPDVASSLPDRVGGFLSRHLPSGARLSLGYSGGLDSSALLHCLAGLRERYPFDLSACHVHHGLSPHADAWAEHCLRIGRILSVPVEVHRVEVRPAGEGFEAAARAARYRVFTSLAADAVALAQHRDDQAETVLLQLLRGGDLRALAAMPARRPLGDKLLLRPLLDVTRAGIEAYARAHHLDWIEDESNACTTLTRNALRHEILPVMVRWFPHAVADLAQTASACAEATELLDALAGQDLRAAEEVQGLRIDCLAAMPPPRALNLLRHFVVSNGGQIHRAALIEALRQLTEADRQARVEVRFGAISLHRFRGHAWLVRSSQTEPVDLVWQGETRMELPGLGFIEFLPAVGAGVRLQPGTTRLVSRRGGERLRLRADRPRRALKDWLREAAIPPWRRQRLPLIYTEGRLAWAAELGPDIDSLAGPGEPGWLISWSWVESAPR